MTDELIWSPYTKESCSLYLDDGTKIGFGSYPVFDVVPGAWNIFWLTFAQLDLVAYYRGDLSKYIVTCDALAVCVGAALQTIENRTLGSLAVSMSPKEFIDVVKEMPTFLPFVFFGASWFKVARSRALKYRVMPDNVIRVDFRKGR